MKKILRARTIIAFVLVAAVNFDLGAQAVNRKTNKTAPLAHSESSPQEKLLAEAKSGDAAAQYIIGYSYMEGLAFERNYDLGLKWLRASAAAGNMDAQNLLVGYLSGATDQNIPGDPSKNRQEALKWLLVLAREGDSDAQDTLGNKYYFGDGVPKDLLVAEHWYGLSAEQGNISAQLNLGRILIYSEDSGPQQQQRWTAGIKWLTICHALAAAQIVDALAEKDQSRQRVKTHEAELFIKRSEVELKPEPWKNYLAQRIEGERQARAWLEIHQRR